MILVTTNAYWIRQMVWLHQQLPPRQRVTVLWLMRSTWLWQVRIKSQHGRRTDGNWYCILLTKAQSHSLILMNEWSSVGILNGWYTRLHCSRNLPSSRLWQRVWLVVIRCNHVWMPCWIPPILFRNSTWNVQKDCELEVSPCFPWWCTP